MNSLDKVNEEVRPAFEANVKYVEKYLVGKGADIGCGSCPLLKPFCYLYVDQNDQPIAIEAVKKEYEYIREMFKGSMDNFQILFKRMDALNCLNGDLFDFVFSSHMLEDLPTKDDVIYHLNIWSTCLTRQGKIVLLLPDIENGRYPGKGQPGSNPSHNIDIGPEYFKKKILPELTILKLLQIDTIPHDRETFDVVLGRK